MKHLILVYICFVILACEPIVKQSTSLNTNNQEVLNEIDELIKHSDKTFNNDLISDSLRDKHLNDAIALCDQYKLDNKKANIYIIIGKRYRNVSNYGYAISYYQKALALAKKTDNDKTKAYSTHEIAVAFRRIDDNAQALMHHLKALEWAESAKDTFLIHSSLNGVGNIYFSYKNFPEAIEYFHKSLLFLGTPPNLLGEAINTNNIGEAWLILNNPDSALFYIKKSYQINVQIESLIGQAICKNGMGNVYIHLKNYKKAIKYYKQSLAINRQMGDLIYVAHNLRNLGDAYFKLKQYQKSERSLIEALDIAREIGSKSEALETLKILSQLYQQTNKPNASIMFLKDAMVYKDSITKEVSEQNTKAMNILYKSQKQEREILILKQQNQLNQLKLSRQRYLSSGIILLLFLGAIFALFIFRQRKLRAKLNEIAAEQKLLRAQLNPHFIFNSLSAVQNFIMQNDKTAAFDYLANFARLMRNILLGSRSENITLDTEELILKDYLKLQQLRFQNIFDYEIIIDASIDTEVCLIPPMLTQPIIENAIEHGLRPLKNNGKLIIKYTKRNTQLLIEVEDNGIGLEASQQNKESTSHLSLATIITKQRLENLQHVSKQNCKIEIIEKNKISNNTGVIVKMTIPFIEEQ